MTVKVTQEDRDAAIRIMSDRWHARHRAEVFAGDHDNWIPVQECATHRIAAEERQKERDAKIAEDWTGPAFSGEEVAMKIATAIRESKSS